MNNKFHKKQAKIQRKIRKRKLIPIFLIVCEGKKTEKCYFNSFNVSTTRIKIITKGAGRSTTDLIKKAISIRNEFEKENKIKIDQTGCVIDKDDNDDLNVAIDFGEKNNILVAYSNKAFELWYILHFKYTTSPMAVHELFEVIDKLMVKFFNRNYKKNNEDIYNLLNENEDIAIKNATKLLEFHENIGDINPENNNPSTTVHKLVLELNKFRRI